MPATKQNRKTGRALGWTVGMLLLAAGLTYAHWFYPGHALGYEQPIAFSHRLHVTDKQIDCFYCHSHPAHSVNSGLPSVQKCFGCHAYVIPNHPEIKKLKAFLKQGVGVPWVRVFYNPDHVYFPHFRHVRAGVSCASCHGLVERMDRLRTHTFYMGFCITCHKKRRASRECTACHQ
jgi:hypothetical protein